MGGVVSSETAATFSPVWERCVCVENEDISEGMSIFSLGSVVERVPVCAVCGFWMCVCVCVNHCSECGGKYPLPLEAAPPPFREGVLAVQSVECGVVVVL